MPTNNIPSQGIDGPNPSPSELNQQKTNFLVDSLDKTNLDVENPQPLGGPNRTNSSNIPTGFYKNKSTHNITDEIGEVVLKEKDGKDVISQLNRWTPTNTYLKSKDWEDKFNQ